MRADYAHRWGSTSERRRLEAAAGARHDAHRRQVAVMQQRVDERAGGMSGRGVHHQTGLLVDHQQVLVLVHHVQRDCLQQGHVADAERGRGNGRHSASFRLVLCSA